MQPVEQTLYFDPQQEEFLLCPTCGGETYPPGYQCFCCAEEAL